MKQQVRIENNVQMVLDELQKATDRALYAIGIKAVEGSVDAITGKYNIPSAVDTGRLRASISFITETESGDSGMSVPSSAPKDKLSGKAEKNTVIVGSNVEYAEYVHNGTSRMAARPFLREGIDQTKDKMEEQVRKIFEGKL